ncbi:MAG: SDR family oxidoreductase [Rhodobacteraceae bacterium]|nr:SDR family oxidoreductase [Paracoccaceae bacterium]
MVNTLLSIGHGYCARALAEVLMPKGWRVIGTTRSIKSADEIAISGAEPVLWSDTATAPLLAALKSATHVLISASPDLQPSGAAGPNGQPYSDPVLRSIGARFLADTPKLKWVGYLSTTGVYGDAKGAWVTENTPLTPTTARGKSRKLAEAEWAAIANLPLHIFRLAGIYGPGRGPLEKVLAGTARRIVKAGQVFSRIHVEDITQVLEASIAMPAPGTVYNVCDDDPAPPELVIAHAARLLGLPVPKAEFFKDAEMTAMSRSFYSESKRVCNLRLKEDLGVKLRYPEYREGLAALVRSSQAVLRRR